MEDDFSKLSINERLFLTKEEFLKHFKIADLPSREELPNILTISYSPEITLQEAMCLEPPKDRKKAIMKSENDFRYKHKEAIVDYYYNVLVTHRERYLGYFYDSYFNFKHPSALCWDKEIRIDEDSISTQKNDKSKTLIRNVFYLHLLDQTTVTNSIKCKVSFWKSLTNLYNKFILEDRFFAPSCIELCLKTKKTALPTEVNYNNLFYLFQQYQPKASILNPYTIHYILNKELKVKKDFNFFTPVLSWGSYLVAAMETSCNHYVGVDVMPTVCEKVRQLSEWYKSTMKVDIILTPSEDLLKNKSFLKRYKNYFDVIIVCPPYWTMELYNEGQQSTERYKNYEEWLHKYWEDTVKVCKHILHNEGHFMYIANDYNDLQKQHYELTKDFENITIKYFSYVKNLNLCNRVSPLRVNKKQRIEKIYIFKNNL